MNIVNFLKLYLVTVPIFFMIDMFWLAFIAKNIYQKYMGHLMRPMPNWPVAILFYLLFIVGLIIFAIYPAVRINSWTHALFYGAMFGFFTYMTFDLTNLAVLKDYSWQITIIDIIWGIILSSTVSVSAFFVGRIFFN